MFLPEANEDGSIEQLSRGFDRQFDIPAPIEKQYIRDY